MEARGGQEQLLLFLTGPAGSEKSTAMRVAEQFSYDFFLAVGVMWSDTTFMFTAYKGSAASLIGGVTISKAAYLNLQRQLNEDDINEWKDVGILVIDEVSFMSNSMGSTKCTLCGIVLFKLNTFLVMFSRVPSIDSTCFPRT
jgi:hypothetical protein